MIHDEILNLAASKEDYFLLLLSIRFDRLVFLEVWAKLQTLFNCLFKI